jgi:general secretion pathway protein A
MYLQFFGMSRMPFVARADGEPLFLAGTHAEALATLVYGLVSAKPLIMLTGDVGLGKTTLLRAALSKVRSSQLRILSLPHPLMQPVDVLRLLGKTLDMPGAQLLRLPDVGEFHRALLATAGTGKRLALIIDEAQLLPPLTLEFVRLLSNLDAVSQGLFYIVLVGQPELWVRVQRPEWRHLRQRIALRAELRPLSYRASADYVRFCMRISNVEPELVLKRGALRALVRRGAGAPRRLNYIADNALLYAFGEGVRPVGARHVRAAAETLDGVDVRLRQRVVRPLRWLGSALKVIFGRRTPRLQ